MRDFPPMTDRSVRCTMVGIMPSIHKTVDAMIASDEYADQVREFRDLFNTKRDHWLTLDDDRDLLRDLIALWVTLESRQTVATACLLRLIAGVPEMSTFPWDQYDSQPLPNREVFHLDRECAPSAAAWVTYLRAKSMLRDQTVIPEIVDTWIDLPKFGYSWPNKWLIDCLAYCATVMAVDTLYDRWLTCVPEGDRQAAQIELCLLQRVRVIPPRLTAQDLEHNGLALLAYSLLMGEAHPVLLHQLRADFPSDWGFRARCRLRPHIRRLCRGPEDWTQNLIRNLRSPQY
jgi:hypothetical protein